MKKMRMWFLWCILVGLTCSCFAETPIECVNAKDYGAKAEGVTFLCKEKNKAVYKVQAGDYEFKSVVK